MEFKCECGIEVCQAKIEVFRGKKKITLEITNFDGNSKGVVHLTKSTARSLAEEITREE